jgi:hypothetical protein
LTRWSTQPDRLDVGEDDVDGAPRQRLRDSEPDSRGAAGDERVLIFEPVHRQFHATAETSESARLNAARRNGMTSEAYKSIDRHVAS